MTGIDSDTDITVDDHYEVVVVGGGPAGLTTALYTTRLNHDTALIDRGGGRAAMMADTHNIIGITEDTSGAELLNTAVEQLKDYGTDVHRQRVTDITPADQSQYRFLVTTGEHTYATDAVVLATGFNDERPSPPLPRTGRGLHYCLHCDGYMFRDEPVYVMGHSDSAAYVAMILLNFTDDVDLLLRDQEPEWNDTTAELLSAHPVTVIESEVTGMFKRGDGSGWLGGFEFADGTTREYTGGFAMYGSSYNNELAASLGCDLNDDGTVAVNDHGETTVDGVYAVGDLTAGHNQIPVAMGEGAKAGIAIHKELRTYPKSLDDIREQAQASAPDQATTADD